MRKSVAVVAALLPSTATAQEFDTAVLDEVTRFASHVALGNWIALGIASTAFVMILGTLKILSRSSAGRPRQPLTEWLCLLALPLVLCSGLILAAANGSVASRPRAECDILSEQPPSVVEARQREAIDRGLAVCKAAEAGTLPLALHVGATPIMGLVAIILTLTISTWYATNCHIVRRSSV